MNAIPTTTKVTDLLIACMAVGVEIGTNSRGIVTMKRINDELQLSINHLIDINRAVANQLGEINPENTEQVIYDLQIQILLGQRVERMMRELGADRHPVKMPLT